MQPVAARLGFALWLTLGLAVSSPAPGGLAQAVSARLIYAAQDDGTLHVYDIDRQHAEVKVIRLFNCCADMRGITAAAPTHRLYVMYNQNDQGHLASLDLLSDQVLWDHVLHAPGVDRGNMTPDGSTVYVPSWEGDPNAPYELVIDADTGAEKTRVSLPPRSHDTIVSLDGQRVFMETKSATASMYVVDTASNEVAQVISGYCCSDVLGPFSINGRRTKVVNNVNGFPGFQLADVELGRVAEYVRFASGNGGHGIAWTPDERQVWVNDGGRPEVHVFDMLVTPPTELPPVAVSNISHWLTFSIDGQYAYVAGRKGAGDSTDVIDAASYQRAGSLSPSEDLLEIDFAEGSVVAIGNQFGIGRITSPQPEND
jgi:DNA-binding beta-propeller fold protein YncE